MKKIISLFLITILSLGSIIAQTSFKLNPYPEVKLNSSAISELNILAVMVEFKEDNDGNTFGNGKFGSIYTQDYGTDILDPLPHNANYFSQHLLFAQNYFEKVSDGMLNISYEVLPNIITVSKIMREYSPALNSESLENIGSLAQEVWSIADQAYPNVQFSDYDMFVIFHAGVGREIPTPGSIGLERDIPSVYLSERGLKEIYGSEFNGFPINDGNFLIKNTAVLPSTENREIESFGEIFLQEFTINGLIVGTIASHLGLPDLFNTETGTSAIGRFGLMDGQALFAYSGLFPPEPSAWEKMYLGWVTPIELNQTDQPVTLTAYEVASVDEKSVVKIPINANEYYLIENRKRDANKDGLTATYQIGSSVNTIKFDKDYEAFSPFGADSIFGVVTDIDEFDWALPGFEEEQTFDDPFGDVGLIIWHIDESVINANIESNTINNDRDRLGVRVVEADGIFDIGEEFTNIFGEIVIGEGTKQDTWYQGNPSEFYENEFNSTTKPPAVSNTGASALIDIDNISEIANVMSFDLSFSKNQVQPLLTKSLQNEAVQISQAAESIVIRNNDGSVTLLNSDGNETGKLKNFSSYELATFFDQANEYVIGAINDSLKILVKGRLTQFQNLLSIKLSSSVAAPIVFAFPDNNLEIFVGLSSGTIEKYLVNLNDPTTITLETSFSAFENQPVKQIAYLDRSISAISNNKYWSQDAGRFELGDDLKQLANTYITHPNLGTEPVVYTPSSIVLGDNTFYVIENNELSSFIVNSADTITSFSLADLKNDGNNYIVFNNESKLEARNPQGVSADLYPYQFDILTTFVGTPLIFDLDSDDNYDVMTFDTNGDIYLIDGSRVELMNPFPISSGEFGLTQPASFINERTLLATVDQNNVLFMWQLSNQSLDFQWISRFQNPTNSSSIGFPKSTSEQIEFFPEDKAYNWPNPVYEDETYIRFYVNENAEAKIKIFDLAGDLVDELSTQAIGGMDNEVTWNVNDVQSGVYFAHLNVTGSSGNSKSKIIKIAVIK